MIRIVTDSASDITRSEADKLDIQLVYLAITFEKDNYNNEADENFETFYNLLEKSKELPKTSQATPAQYLDIFTDAKLKNDDVIVITLSSGLSGTYDSAKIAKEMNEYNKITVIDSKQATIAQRLLVYHAVRLRAEGKNAQEITADIEDVRERITVCGILNTLTYLKKGGRVPPALSLIANTFNIKPVIVLRNKKLEMLGKAKGFNNGKKILYKELEKVELDAEWPVYFGYTKNEEVGAKFMQETIDKYGLKDAGIYQVGSVIGTHVGPGCAVIVFVKKS